MKILAVKSLAIEAVKVIRFGRFRDERGYFSEALRQSDFQGHPELAFLRDVVFSQVNQSFSRPGTIRGLHFQWKPYMGKLVRTLSGRMVDVALDVRKGSPTFGRAVLHDMPEDPSHDHQEWIWVPPGFAHGNFFQVPTLIEYFCSGEYSPACEAGISPLAPDIDWTLSDPFLRAELERCASSAPLMSAKDRDGHSLESWSQDERSDYFIYGEL